MGLKFATVANCQASPVASLLGLACTEIEVLRIPAVHTVTSAKLNGVLDILDQADVIVHQPIGDNFGPISTQELKDRFPEKNFVSFPSIYFSGTLPHLSYLRQPGGGTLKGPLGDYHDLRILRGYRVGWSPEVSLARFEDHDFPVRDWYDKAVTESVGRDSGPDVSIMDVILDRIGQTQTMYTFNHCDNDTLWAVVTRLLHHLNLPNDGLQAPPKKRYLAGVIAAVPRVVTTTLGVDWSAPQYVLNGQPAETLELIEAFHEVYRQCENFENLLAHNSNRFGLSL